MKSLSFGLSRILGSGIAFLLATIFNKEITETNTSFLAFQALFSIMAHGFIDIRFDLNLILVLFLERDSVNSNSQRIGGFVLATCLAAVDFALTRAKILVFF